jgi:exonuclease III
MKILLIRSGVESNPGPKNELKIVSHNVRGLTTGRNKLRSILSLYKSNDNISNLVLCLQETHVLNARELNCLWKGETIVNNGTRSSCGVAILMSDNWSVKNVIKDNEGRMIIIHAFDSITKGDFVITNIYAPNNHMKAKGFFIRTFEYIKALKEKISEEGIDIAGQFFMGDFNFASNEGDRSTKCLTHQEKELAEHTNEYLEALSYEDCSIYDYEQSKFTWKNKRNGALAQSRIDRLYCSTDYIRKCNSFTKKWGIGKSDHASLFATFHTSSKVRGKGILKLNSNILESVDTKQSIRLELQKWISNTIPEWDANTKWEYCKMALRSIVLPIMGKANKERSSIKENIINKMSEIRNRDTSSNTKVEIDNTEKEYTKLQQELDGILDKESEWLAFRSGVKWREEGEKSNKYFLGALKRRYDETYVDALRDQNGKLQHNIQQVIGIAQTFYKNLYSMGDTVPLEHHCQLTSSLPTISKQDSNQLDRPITLDELKLTLKDIKDSAPGEDGIPYTFYKTYIDILGPYLLESWEHSLKTGLLTNSQRRSCISLLPKKGKDGQKIENWRPISLSNCDLKIITKTIAARMSKVLPTIIHESQAAYVPNRNIANNIRMMKIGRAISNKDKIPSLLISLDVKKAYDSLSHTYLYEIMKKYGFSEQFINTIKTLYRQNELSVIVNGFKSNHFKVERGVKQGDALSCGLFIIAMDPLVRQLDSNKSIKELKARTNSKLKFLKCLAYADDIAIMCLDKIECIRAVFKIYEKFTKCSGLELNADKTEILEGGQMPTQRSLKINYLGNTIHLSPVEKVIIGGISFHQNPIKEHNDNTVAKIDKMETQLKRWMSRNLSLNGKSIVAKTFGLSQIIYSMQSCEFKQEDLTRIERTYFKFLWSKSWNKNAPERIKRSYLKNDKDLAGINALDITSMYEAIKLKKIQEAMNDGNILKEIQYALLEEGNNNYKGKLNYDFKSYSTTDHTTACSQKTINKILDYYRKVNYSSNEDEMKTDMILMALDTDIEAYARRHNFQMVEQLVRKLNYNKMKNLNLAGMKTLLDSDSTSLIYEQSFYQRLSSVWTHLPPRLRSIAEISIEQQRLKCSDLVIWSRNKTCDLKKSTLKDIQHLLKRVNDKIAKPDFNKKYDLDIQEETITASINKTYRTLKNPTLRNLRHRLWHNDIFCGSKMKKLNMTDTDRCERCGKKENTQHQLFECRDAQKMWDLYNKLMVQLKLEDCKVLNFTSVVFTTKFDNPITDLLKTVIIKLNIQIKRPKFGEKTLKQELLKYVRIEIAARKSNNVRWKELKEILNQSSNHEQVPE